MSFKIGDLVTISESSQYYCGESMFNPIDMIGVIISTSESPISNYRYVVSWAPNKCITNSYKEKDLTLLDKDTIKVKVYTPRFGDIVRVIDVAHSEHGKKGIVVRVKETTSDAFFKKIVYVAIEGSEYTLPFNTNSIEFIKNLI